MPYRQWVLTLPSELARVVAFDADLATAAAGADKVGATAQPTADKAPEKAVGGRNLDDLVMHLNPIGTRELAIIGPDAAQLKATLNEAAFSRWLFDDAIAALLGNKLTIISEANEAKLLQIDRMRQLMSNPQWASRMPGAPAAELLDSDQHIRTEFAKDSGKLTRLKEAMKVADKAMGVVGVVSGALNVANGLDAYNSGTKFSHKANAVTTIVQGAGGMATGLLALAGSAAAAPVGLAVAAIQLRSRGAQVMQAWANIKTFGLGEWAADGGGVPGVVVGAFVTAVGLLLETVVGALATIGDIGAVLGSAGGALLETLMKIFGLAKGDFVPDDPWIPPEARTEDKGPAPVDPSGPRKDGHHDTERKLPQTHR